MESRIKQLRENRGLIQEILAAELGITQQMLSKYERDILCIKVDVLMKIAEYFNVTTDYLLGISEVKRDLQGQMKMNKTLDTYYDLIEIYKDLDEYDQKIEVFWNGKSLADAVAQGTYFDMIYLDIEMDKEDGISAAKRIREYDKNTLIIYVTSHENHMQESFEVRPVDLYLKLTQF